MSERAHFNKSEPATGKPRETKPDCDPVDITARRLLDAIKTEVSGKPEALDAARTVRGILQSAACAGPSFVNAVVRRADHIENVANSTAAGRLRHLPKIILENSNRDNPLIPPLYFKAERTAKPDSLMGQVVESILAPFSIDKTVHLVPGGSSDACKPKPHGKSLAPRG